MDKDKIKKAFQRIKEDMQALDFKTNKELDRMNNELVEIRENLSRLKEVAKLNEDVKGQIDNLKNMNIDNYISQLKENYKFIKETNENFNKRFESFHMQFNDLKDKIDKFSETANNNADEIRALTHKVDSMKSEVDEKINLEMANFKMEVYEEMSKLRNELTGSKEGGSSSKSTKGTKSTKKSSSGNKRS